MIASLLLFRRRIDTLRATARTTPWIFVWLSLGLTGVLLLLGAVHPPLTIPSGWLIWPVRAILSFFGLLYVGGMASWGLRRQAQKKAWGVPLPSEAPTWLFRPGVWAGLTVGLTWQVLILAVGILLWVGLKSSLGFAFAGAAGTFGIVYGLRATALFYGLPNIRYLVWVAFAPFLGLALVGIVAAIAIPQIQHYEHLKAQAALRTQSSALRSQPTPSPQAQGRPTVLAPRGTTPESPASRPAAFMTPSSGGRPNDAVCGDQRPLAVPYTARWSRFCTVVAFLPPWQARRILARTEQTTHGWIEPRYQNDPRVILHPVGAPPRVRILAVVPASLTVHEGERVMVVGGHRSHHRDCQYAPNLITVRSGG